jgi:hypothetical protein
VKRAADKDSRRAADGSFADFLLVGVLLAICFGVIGHGLYVRHIAGVAESWPKAEGKILRCEFVKLKSRDSSQWFAVKVEYSYTVAGTPYRGTELEFRGSEARGLDDAQRIYNSLRTATSYPVSYDPARPARAVLLYGADGSSMLSIFIGAVLSLVLIALLVVLIASRRSELRAAREAEAALERGPTKPDASTLRRAPTAPDDR